MYMNEYKIKSQTIRKKKLIFSNQMSYWFILQSSGENGQTYQYYKSCIYMYDSWKLHVLGNNTGLVKYKLFVN